MYDSPVSLQNICIDFICDNLEALCESTASCDASATEASQQAVVAPPKCQFREEGVYIHADISEKLLTALSEKKKLTDITMTLFDAGTTRLRHVQVSNAGDLTTHGLRVLKGHKVYDLELTDSKVSINDLVGCLGEWTLHNLRSLNLARSALVDGNRYCVVVALSKLKSLHSLNVSYTEFNRFGLETVADDLPGLESLDISATRVDDISALRKWRTTLKTLAMYNLKILSGDSVSPVLLELEQLRTLDISDDRDQHHFDVFTPTRSKVTRLLRAHRALPHLASLDLSGKEDVDSADLLQFMRHHPRLQFLGLVHSDACFDDVFLEPKHPEHRPHLVVSGMATEAQILAGLARYSARPFYVQKCLYNLFRLTPNFSEARVDVIKLVSAGMGRHPHQFGVQMAATACLYNLTKGELSSKIHPSTLRRVVELTLVAMETFPNHYQLQKNTLLTLCSDRILQEVTFNKYHCATLVMNCLCSFDDASMNRMSVAICSILAAKISTNETSQLGARPQYMRKLLDIVQSKVQCKQVDITVKFTLSALWNLTDESPQTCKVFLQQNGMPLFLEVLSTFSGEATIETKVLGLINNIAEVAELRHELMVTDFLNMLRQLLHSGCIDVSYFAAGIIAHLASDSGWSDAATVPRGDMLAELGTVVSKWATPDGEMVAYRSFRPFFPLLALDALPQVQLWAVWAIHHVCTKNGKRYCPMLVQEGGSDIVRRLAECACADAEVRRVCRQILEAVTSEAQQDPL